MSACPRTARTIAARSELEAELDRIRAQGYARNDGESDDHITSAAAVVRDRAGLARFAISVSAPLSEPTRRPWTR